MVYNALMLRRAVAIVCVLAHMMPCGGFLCFVLPCDAIASTVDAAPICADAQAAPESCCVVLVTTCCSEPPKAPEPITSCCSAPPETPLAVTPCGGSAPPADPSDAAAAQCCQVCPCCATCEPLPTPLAPRPAPSVTELLLTSVIFCGVAHTDLAAPFSGLPTEPISALISNNERQARISVWRD